MVYLDDPQYEYDPQVDALSIVLLPKAKIVRTVEMDDDRHLDFDSRGRVVAIEILNASLGVQVDDLIGIYDLDEVKGQLRDIANMDFRPAVAL